MNKRIIFVSGHFDVIHIGHLKLLEFAKNKGDLLYVAMPSDYRITQEKGIKRPYNNWETRCEIMKAIRWVDKVVMFDTDYQLERLIEKYKPLLLVFGKDEEGKKVIGKNFSKGVEYFPVYDGLSSTSIIKKINMN